MAIERLPTRQSVESEPAIHESVAPVGRLPLEDIRRLYPKEWVAIRVTALNERHAISHGEVLAHSPSRAEVSTVLLRAHREQPGVRTFVFYGGPIAYSLDDLPGLLEEAELLYPDAWR